MERTRTQALISPLTCGMKSVNTINKDEQEVFFTEKGKATHNAARVGCMVTKEGSPPVVCLLLRSRPEPSSHSALRSQAIDEQVERGLSDAAAGGAADTHSEVFMQSSRRRCFA